MQSMTIEQLRAATHAGGVAGVTLCSPRLAATSRAASETLWPR